MLRFLKQLFFGLFFLAIFGGAGVWIYKVTRPVPTCFDKVQNQAEEGVDCGAICGNTCLSSLGAIEVRDSYLFTINQGSVGLIDYDALFLVSNPNTQFGSPRVDYELSVFDSRGTILLNKKDAFYILPGQIRYIYEPLLKTKTPAQRAELKITKVDWQKLNGIFGEDVEFVIKSKDYLVNDRPGIFSLVNGIMFNASDFDFDRVDVVAVLFKNGQLIGAGRTDLRTFPTKSDRFFEITWVSPIEAPDRIDVEASTNVFENSNFLRKYGTPERFQQP